MLNVTRLRILRELHLRGTLAQVAQALSYTPSAISQQLTMLERETGVTLLEHIGRGVQLTDEARTLVAHTEIVLAQLEEAEAELAAAQPTVRGTLRLASILTVVVEIAPAVVTLLATSHPALHLEITMREVEPAFSGLLSAQFDVILGEDYPGFPDLVREGTDRSDLVTDPLLLAVPSRGPMSGPPRRLAELDSAPWALDPPGTASGDWARAVCRAAGFEPQVRYEGPYPLLHAHLVRTGHAVAFIPGLIAADHLHGTQLTRLPGDPHRTLYTAVRAGRAGHPAVRALRDAMAQVVADRPAQSPAGTLQE